MDAKVSNEDIKLEQKQTWSDKLKPANPIGFAISSVISITAVLVFFFAIPCPEDN